MKKLILIAGLIASGLSLAAEPPKPAPAGAPVAGQVQPGQPGQPGERAEFHRGMRDDMHKQFREENFPEVKKTILEQMTRHQERIQKNKACVEASTNHDGLRACHEQMRADAENDHPKRAELRKEMREHNHEQGEGRRGEPRGPQGAPVGQPAPAAAPAPVKR